MWPFSKSKPSRSELLVERPITSDYEAPLAYGNIKELSQRRPPFTSLTADAMVSDPRVLLGLSMIKGPILANSKFFVDCDNPEVKQFIIDQINRFWTNSASVALRSLEYGYLGCEVLYKQRSDGLIHFDQLKFLHPRDCRIVTNQAGDYTGFQVTSHRDSQRKLYVGGPKAFWSVHKKDVNRWYGRSRLYGAYLPWYEIWSRNGFRDLRFLWYYKHSYQGPRIGYPIHNQAGPDGTVVSNKTVARQLGDMARAGHSIAYPVFDATLPQWMFEDAKAVPAPEGLLEYGDRLEKEIWIGMEIPPEVVESDGTGAFAGRLIPQQAFFSTLQDICNETITDYHQQILEPLVNVNYGPVDFDIQCYDMNETAQEKQPSPYKSPNNDQQDQDNDQPFEGGPKKPFSQKFVPQTESRTRNKTETKETRRQTS